MNSANALTLFRILLLPGFLIAVLYDQRLLALGLFLLAGATDVIDGFLARRLGQETVLGAFLDPVADKLLMAVSFIALAAKGLLPAWLAVLVVSKDLFVSLGVAILYFSGQPVAAAPTRWGKQTTFLQVLAVAVALSVKEPGAIPLWPLWAVTGAVTSFSGLHYIVSGIRALPEPAGAPKSGEDDPAQ